MKYHDLIHNPIHDLMLSYHTRNLIYNLVHDLILSCPIRDLNQYLIHDLIYYLIHGP
jgi:hypothetical protein